jgi:5-methylcytosine-specific restriction endonuclease McrA
MKRIPTMKELKEQALEPAPCPLCKRPNHHPSDHHLVPRTRGGKVTTTICRDCHSAIHATFSNKELEREYSTIEALLSHEGFAATVRFISTQDGRVRTDLNRRQRRRGRKG